MISLEKNVSKFKNLKLIFLIVFAGCAHGDSKKDSSQSTSSDAKSSGVSIEAKQAGAEEGTSLVTEVQFEKGSASLSLPEQKRISDSFSDVEKKHPLKRVSILSWGDVEMPTQDQKDLPDSEVKLAEVRADFLAQFIHSLNSGVKTDTVNMAKKPGKLKEFLKTKDVRVRELLEMSQGKADPKASKSILLIFTQKN